MENKLLRIATNISNMINVYKNKYTIDGSKYGNKFEDPVEAKVKGYIYHATDSKNIESIKKEGLKTNKVKRFKGYSTGEIFFALDVEDAEYYAKLGGSKDYKVLRVNGNREGLNSGYAMDEVASTKDIRPKDIEIFNNNRWIKL